MSALPDHMLGKIRECLREFGLRETAERSILWLADRRLASSIHRHNRPTLASFAEAATSMHFSAKELAEMYFFAEQGEAELAQLSDEYDVLCREIDERYRERNQIYPHQCALEKGSAFLIYAMVRSSRPSIVLETGVANGHSSFFILRAMHANGHGSLHSVDRSPQVGSLLACPDRKRWNLHILQSNSLKKSFLQILDTIPPIDLFLHDSDHTYAWQSFELNAAMRKLAPGGTLASDDCDSGNAFLDFCKKSGSRPVVLVENRKIFGLIFDLQRMSRSTNSKLLKFDMLTRAT
ncbi:MAG TPA: class I SAM-dependent methyltransferase [Candidatus Acidoferrales bacterium]|nr:class I SAM-dependent methyltransferase [Candidatus Acidoferrales bacterium]